MEHATLSASLEAVLLRLAELTPAGAVVSEQAAVLLAGVASELGARPGSVDEAHQQADELRRIIRGAPALLEPLLVKLAPRLAQQQLLGAQTQELALTLASSAALRVCLLLAAFVNLGRQDALRLASLAMRCFLRCGIPAMRMSAAVSRSYGQISVPTSTLVLSLLELATSGLAAVERLGADAVKLAPPAALAACLTDAVALTRMAEQRATEPAEASVLRAVPAACIAALLEVARSTDTCQPHADAITAQPWLRSEVVPLALSTLRRLAVALRLPEGRRPLGCGWHAVGPVAGLLSTEMLGPAVDAWCEAADGASFTAVLAAAAQLVEDLPLERVITPTAAQQGGAAGSAVSWATMYYVVCLPGTLCTRATDAVLARQSSEQRRRVVQHALPAVSRLPQLLQLLAESSPEAGLAERVLHFCSSVRHLVHQLALYLAAQQEQAGAVVLCGLADAVACARAAAAVQRSLSHMYALLQHSACSTVDIADVLLYIDAADRLAARAAKALAQEAAPEAMPAGGAADAQQAIWALHTALCRRVHRAAAAGGAAVVQADKPPLRWVLVGLGCCMVAMLRMHTELRDLRLPEPEVDVVTRSATRRLRAMSVAHWEAVAACRAGHPEERWVLKDPTLLLSLAVVVAHAPLALALSPDVHQLCSRLWRHLPQEFDLRVERLLVLLSYAASAPHLAAFLAANGYLESILKDSIVPAGTAPALGIVRVLVTLLCASQSLIDSAAPTSDSEAALLQHLQTATDAAGKSMGQGEVTVPQLRRSALPANRCVGAALLNWWRRPTAQQEQQLEAAQAAAARSCAYLRCTNLGSSGGPAAGQGEGSQRCSACRTVWYCGTACSHADWRAGHKRVCKALGAARAAVKAARQAASVAKEQ